MKITTFEILQLHFLAAVILCPAAWADQPARNAKVPLDAHGKPIVYKYSDFTSMHFSNNIPTNFIAPYPNCSSNSGMVNSTRGGPAATMSMTTKDSPESVLKWYQDYLGREHWSVRAPSSTSMQKLGAHGMTFLNATKERQNLTIVCAPQPKTALTGISVSWFLR